MSFPQYLGIFSKIITNTSQPLLDKYISPNTLIKANRQELIDKSKSTTHFGFKYATNKYDALSQATHDANNFVCILGNNIKHICLYISFIHKYDKKINTILDPLHELVDANEDTDFVKQFGKFEDNKIQSSKRGASIARRVIYILILQSIGFSRTTEAKLIAIEAVSHKVKSLPFFTEKFFSFSIDIY